MLTDLGLNTASDLIDAFAVGMLVLAIGVLWVRWLGPAILLVAAQALLLAGAALVAGLATDSAHIVVGAGLTAAVKGLGAPLLLWIVLRRLPTTHEAEAILGRRVGVVFAIVVALIFAQTFDVQPFRPQIGASHVLPTAVSVMVIGLQLMVTRRKALTQIVGFLMLENGMALAALTATPGMPLVVELGILLDLLLVVLVAFVYTQRIQAQFGSTDVERLRSLRG